MIQKLAFPVFLIAAGVIVISAVALLEQSREANQPWIDAILAPDAPLPGNASEAFIPVCVIRLADDNLTERDAGSDRLKKLLEGTEFVAALGLDKNERVIAFPFARTDVAPLLASGRVPVPGEPEAIAGCLARFDSFTFAGKTFRVVGRLPSAVDGVGFSYLVSDAEPVCAQAGATQGWIDPEGLSRPEPGDKSSNTAKDSERIGGISQAPTSMAIAIIIGLVLIACGGSCAQLRVFRGLSERPTKTLGTVFGAIAAHPRLAIAMHVLLYGVLFGFMLLACEHPLASLRLNKLVRAEFLTGGLSYIGAAYASGEILRACAATFFQNFLVATLLMTFLPSLVLPFAGLFKTMVSFAAVGFVMAPLWSGSAESLTYHGITMTLEMEAYIIASFLVVVFPVRLIKAAFSATPLAGIAAAFRLMWEGVQLTGLMLLFAAFYEAATLILLR